MLSRIKAALCSVLVFGAMALHAQETPEQAAKPKVQIPPWVEIQYRMEFLAGKIGVMGSTIRKLLEEKRKMSVDAPEVKELIQRLVQSHKELESLVQEHEKLNTQLKFRYPERSAKEEQQVSFEIKPLEEMEQEMGVDTALNKVLRKMHGQYGYDPETLAAQKKKSEKRVPASQTKKYEPAGKKSLDQMTIDEMPPIVLQK